jgi:hypothetical protein
MPRLLGVYDRPGNTAAAVRQLRERGYSDLVTFAPASFPEVEDAADPKPSKVRRYTLIGGLAGVVTGYAITIWMANNWQIVIGGKPYSSIPPYTIIAFELTILFGGLLTALGLFIQGKLLRFRKHDAYSARFSAEDFGVVVRCQARDVSELEALLRAHGATEVTLVES